MLILSSFVAPAQQKQEEEQKQMRGRGKGERKGEQTWDFLVENASVDALKPASGKDL
jgi:hypothetical protein